MFRRKVMSLWFEERSGYESREHQVKTWSLPARSDTLSKGEWSLLSLASLSRYEVLQVMSLRVVKEARPRPCPLAPSLQRLKWCTTGSPRRSRAAASRRCSAACQQPACGVGCIYECDVGYTYTYMFIYIYVMYIILLYTYTYI